MLNGCASKLLKARARNWSALADDFRTLLTDDVGQGDQYTRAEAPIAAVRNTSAAFSLVE